MQTFTVVKIDGRSKEVMAMTPKSAANKAFKVPSGFHYEELEDIGCSPYLTVTTSTGEKHLMHLVDNG